MVRTKQSVRASKGDMERILANISASASGGQPSQDSVPARTNASHLTQHQPHGIIRLPTNVFVQITTYLGAVDLLFLARTAGHFRKVLMTQSSAYIWRGALAKMAGLPPCPPMMSEPLYTALIFTEDCSSCWSRANSPLETDLLIRLCAQCRRTGIVVDADEISREISALIGFGGRALRAEVEATTRQITSLKAAPDGQAKLAAWKKEKVCERLDRQNLAVQLTQFIKQQLAEEKKVTQRERQAEITRRLLEEEGWSPEHLIIPKQSRMYNKWMSQLNRPSVLTDNEWYSLRLDLNNILTQNTQERRQEPRWARLEALWDSVKTDLIQPTRTKGTSRTLTVAISEASNLKPIPEFSDALGWPIIKELLNTNRPVSEMEARFVRERPAIDREVSAWCARTKASLVDVVRKSLVQGGCITHAPVTGTITSDPLQSLPPDMQLLLRADTIFAPYKPDLYRDSPKSGFCGYETYMQELRQWIGYQSNEHWRPVSDARFQVHPTAPAIARALLGALGRPLHTTILELETRGEQFVCGRCDDEKPKSWLEMIKYYLDRQEEWGHIAEHMDWFTKNSVAAHNYHNLKSDSPKPLVRLFSSKERPANATGAEEEESEKLDYVILCGPCLRASFHATPMTRLQALIHLRDMHDISEPRLGDLEVDLWESKRRNYRVIPTDCLEEDGTFVHDDFDCDSWWEAGSERGSEENDDE